MAQDSDSVKAIKALEDVEKHLQDVTARVQRGATWAWQHDGVTYIDVFGFQDVTQRAGKAIEEAAPLFEVYLHTLGRVPPRFKAVFEQAAALMDWIGSLEDQHGAEYHLTRALKRLQRVELGLQDLCTLPSKAAMHQEANKREPTTTREINSCLLVSADKQAELLKKLHQLIDGKKGKAVALVIRSCVELGLMSKPTFGVLKAEFGDIGHHSNYDKYFSGYPQRYVEHERQGMIRNLEPFKAYLNSLE